MGELLRSLPLWLVPTLPAAGFLVLALAGGRLPRRRAGTVGVGSVGLSAAVTLGIAAGFLDRPPEGGLRVETLWTWIDIGAFEIGFNLALDALSLVMIFVVTFVGFLIHLYSTEYMADDEAYSRFFAYMNLFVACMLMLVLADNLFLLYLGWEGVGLCSYLLIGFWYSDPANGAAARKAFIVTRVGDTAMAVALLLLFKHAGTLDIRQAMAWATASWPVGSGMAVAVALLLLGGAVGKSAQLPLQTWLPDAMAGPTPVSALIHAATMVTAGVYLIARTHAVFLLAPQAMTAVAIVGAATLLLAGCSALVQTDIKRVLAYSTISQIGYMFLGLGVGAWSAAVFHLMTHAFFKALLFLGAGAVILALHHEQDIFRMGGLRRRLPAVFWTFLAGAASLAALPLVTAGFFSKDLILWAAWGSAAGCRWLWAAGAFGALLTTVYSFRLVFVVFFGDEKGHVGHPPGPRIVVPLTVLAALSIVGGFVETPGWLGHVTWFTDLTGQTLPAVDWAVEDHHVEHLLQMVVAGITLVGVLAAWLLYVRRPALPAAIKASAAGAWLARFWLSGWGFDALYDRIVVRPFVACAARLRRDPIDRIPAVLAATAAAGNAALSRTQDGRIRSYVFGIGLGAVIAVAIVVLT
ncbi:MAG: NADH-quinone oxidoreductase subunit L [Thermoanaerobaculales bacterium]|nr:NADH-quinone oxidoreductase subunit L [Thermoanaerobaculales bacterium]